MIFCASCKHAFAQHTPFDSARILQEFVVEAPRISGFTPGLNTVHFDAQTMSAYRQKNLTDLLADESSLFIKSYGLGSLATSSMRGGSANHTAVLWNGITLASSMNGLLDMSLVPVVAADKVSVQYGGNSALYGSGAVAGIIHLNSDGSLNKGTTVEANISAGSYANFRQNVYAAKSMPRFISSVRLFNHTAKNDFLFENIYLADQPQVRLSNAELKSYGVISENKFLIGRHQVLSVHAWLQHTDRNTPPTMLQKESKTNQKDDSVRLTAQWKLAKKKSATFVRAAWLWDNIDFSDGLTGLYQVSESRQLVAEAESKITLTPAHAINIGIHNTYATANHPSFENAPHQNRLAFFASYLYATPNNKMHASISGRQELTGLSPAPFTYSAGANYALLPALKIRFNFSKVYRVPTFNDLYWVPGGNPDLNPEEGYAAEAGLHLVLNNTSRAFKSDVTIFNRNVNNWIVWVPGVSYWSPKNIMSVHSRGMETNSSLSFAVRKSKITIQAATGYAPSTNSRSKTANDNSIGKQLVYTPMYSGMAKITFEHAGFSTSYRHNYIGYRYTSTDNAQFLTPYDLGALFLNYAFDFRGNHAGLFFEINNLWDAEYQVLSNRAMPGINFNGGIHLHFNKPNK